MYILLITAVLLGVALVLFLKPSTSFIQLLLAFSGAYLLSITVLHLIPEVYMHNEKSSTLIGILILAGLLLQSILESFSKGAEHGHIHVHSKTTKFPTLLFVSLCIHAFSEGVPVVNNTQLLWAIVIHKIPIAIVLTVFLQQANYPKKISLLFLSVFALMSPLGAFVAQQTPFFTLYHTEITAFIIGVFLHISTIILFESSSNHSFDVKKFMAVLLGIAITLVTLHY